jgi:DNA-binding NtrC family response regulator
MHLAVIDDDINMRKSLESSLMASKDNFKISAYKSATDALNKLDDSVDLLIVDINMPKINGIELLNRLEGKYDAIIITGNATLDLTIKAMRAGATDFLQKPFEIKTLLESIHRIKEVNKRIKVKISTKKNNYQFYASSPKLDECLILAKKVARTDASTILFGESGAGKELFANYIHQNSKRVNAPFIAVNMAAIPHSLIESELFGYEKGAFTDATEPKMGKFELANGGSIFLDEIAEMPIELQAKLLRALQEKEIHRLGGNKVIKIDIRVISATNANLQTNIKNGLFREDLYYRINTVPINIPPLRERKEEIIVMSNKFLAECFKTYEDMEEKTLSKEAESALLTYRWPGNIRELKSVIERSFILSDNKEITKEDLALSAREPKENIEDLEKNLYVEAYETSNKNIKECAKLLNIDEDMLLKKLKKLKII